MLSLTIPLVLPPVPARAEVAASTNPASSIPDAPQPQGIFRSKPKAPPCRVITAAEAAGSAAAAVAMGEGNSVAGVAPAGTHDESSQPGEPTQLPACPPAPPVNWFARFLNGPQVKRLTPREKALLAVRNVLDPFNAVTIMANAAIAVGSDSHSPYGPGMTGFGRYVGVELLTGHDRRVLRHLPHPLHRPPGPALSPNAERLISSSGCVTPSSRWFGPRATTAKGC